MTMAEQRQILIVDDEREILDILHEVFLDNGYGCHLAADGRQGLELFQAVHPMLTITDLRMPGIDGLEFLKAARGLDPDAAIIVLTGAADVKTAIECLKQGAADFILKPVNVEELLVAAERAVERRQLLIERRQYEATLERRVEEATRDLAYLAQYDSLTGLANRGLFRDRLAQALARADRHERLVALLFLDLDGFKAINDTLGHDAGDNLLKTVADRLRGCVRRADTVARLGGDEFAVILEGVSRIGDATAVAQKILDTVALPFILNGQEVFVTTSIGIAVYRRDGEDAEALTKNADTAMYRAKEQGRSTYQIYTADLHEKILQRLALESGLRRALERGEFLLYYQPRVNLRSGAITGMEALLRWRHPERGLVSPVEFIPVAEESGLIIPIGEWVLREACAQSRAWHAAGLPRLRVAVNLSARQFRHKDLAEAVARIVAETGLEPEWLELELTEGFLMENTQASSATLAALKAMGLRISIDDFGTGYSSLNYLQRFPIDTLKIDQSFVRGIPTDPDAAAIVTAIIALAHSLRLEVVAEGAETKEQIEFLKAQGCDEIQGYLFSPPLPAAAFVQFVRERRLA